jgi:hypothetical protein
MVNRRSASGLHGTEARQWWRNNRSEDIERLAREFGYECKKLTPYQLRVGGAIDFYPTNGRAHILATNKRIDFHTADDVFKLLQQI